MKKLLLVTTAITLLSFNCYAADKDDDADFFANPKELSLSLFPKWQRVLEKANFPKMTTHTRLSVEKIKEINNEVNNSVRYKDDYENCVEWQCDYWQTPQETTARKRGDCEDFAIMKEALLIKAGMNPADILLVTMSRKLDKNTSIAHTVVEVTADDGSVRVMNLKPGTEEIIDSTTLKTQDDLKTATDFYKSTTYKKIFSLTTEKALQYR